MSDLDGERAFDLITDRMLDLNSRLDAACRERDEARDARLAEIAAELNALRAILPQQAAAVAIELGHQARMLQHEAQGGTT